MLVHWLSKWTWEKSYTSVTPEKRSPKCTSSPSSLKRMRSSQYMNENNLTINQGSWTLQETCILDAVQSFLSSTTYIIPTAENIASLFNFVVNSTIVKTIGNIQANVKTERQITGEIEYTIKRKELRKKIFCVAAIDMQWLMLVSWTYLKTFYLSPEIFHVVLTFKLSDS